MTQQATGTETVEDTIARLHRLDSRQRANYVLVYLAESLRHISLSSGEQGTVAWATRCLSLYRELQRIEGQH